MEQSVNDKCRFSDLLVTVLDMSLSLFIFFSVREYLRFGHYVDLRTVARIEFTWWHVGVVVVLALLWNRIFTLGRRHRSTEGSWVQCVKHAFITASAGAAVMIMAAHLLGITHIDALFSRWFWLVNTAAFLVYRLVWFVLQAVSERTKVRYFTIVGANDRALSIVNSLKGSLIRSRFFDLPGNKKLEKGGFKTAQKVTVGTVSDFHRFISEHPTDEVIITLPLRSCYDQIMRMIELCAQQGVRVRFHTDLFALPTRVTTLFSGTSRVPLIFYEPYYYPELHLDFKRVFDVLLSLVGLLLLAPVFVLVALLIIWDDGFPVFFVQKRVGLNKRRFNIYKFRTMIRGAEKLQERLEHLNEYEKGAAFKIANDPRIIRVGNFLRRSSLDELPQLVNVLLGDMSLVGPRPLPMRDFERFYNHRHRLRFSVKPGITGLWQVSGRNDIEFEEWMGLDRQYVEHWDLILDFKILLKTLLVVVSRDGAK